MFSLAASCGVEGMDRRALLAFRPVVGREPSWAANWVRAVDTLARSRGLGGRRAAERVDFMGDDTGDEVADPRGDGAKATPPKAEARKASGGATSGKSATDLGVELETGLSFALGLVVGCLVRGEEGADTCCKLESLATGGAPVNDARAAFAAADATSPLPRRGG